jgi:hypothetical protein
MVSHTALQIAYYQSGRDHMDVEDVLEFFEQRSEEHRGRATSKASAPPEERIATKTLVGQPRDALGPVKRANIPAGDSTKRISPTLRDRAAVDDRFIVTLSTKHLGVVHNYPKRRCGRSKPAWTTLRTGNVIRFIGRLPSPTRWFGPEHISGDAFSQDCCAVLKQRCGSPVRIKRALWSTTCFWAGPFTGLLGICLEQEARSETQPAVLR